MGRPRLRFRPPNPWLTFCPSSLHRDGLEAGPSPVPADLEKQELSGNTERCVRLANSCSPQSPEEPRLARRKPIVKSTSG